MPPVRLLKTATQPTTKPAATSEVTQDQVLILARYLHNAVMRTAYANDERATSWDKLSEDIQKKYRLLASDLLKSPPPYFTRK
jgi:hypothetical protein